MGEAMSGFEVRLATAEDAPGIRRLFERIFKTELSEGEWRWKFPQNPDGWHGVVGLVDGAVVGNYAGWAMSFLFDGEPRPLYSVGDVATDPSVRALGGRRGVYLAMADLFYERIGPDVPCCFGFPNARALHVGERVAGTRKLFDIGLKKVPVEALGPPPADMESGDSVDEAFDPLWAAGSRTFTHGVVRDRARVNWRFHARPSRYYRMVWRRQGAELAGWAVLSVVGEEATVADYLGREPDGSDLTSLFAAAADEPRGGPGRTVIEGLPGKRLDAGFPMGARVFDEDAVRRFAARLHLVPSLYDLV
jgi:hypothetical protein